MKNKTVGRLINDEQLKHLLNDSEYYGTHAWDEFCDMISECDAVDAVQVVRCKDCKHASPWFDGCAKKFLLQSGDVFCGLHSYLRQECHKPDWYCADGERKTE